MKDRYGLLIDIEITRKLLRVCSQIKLEENNPFA